MVSMLAMLWLLWWCCGRHGGVVFVMVVLRWFCGLFHFVIIVKVT